MAITFLQEKKKQRQMILILALVMVVILFIIWQFFLKAPKESVVPAKASFSAQKVSIDWETLKDQKIESLEIFKQITPFSGAIGRKNPFIPY